MKRIILISLIFLGLVKIGHSKESLSSQIKDAQRKIIISTVEFLATDDLQFKNVSAKVCKCNTYADLVKYAKNNQITGTYEESGGLINSWKNITIDTLNYKQSLNNFKNQILEKITSGSKAYRKSLASYNPYVNSIDNLISEIKLPEPVPDRTKNEGKDTTTKPIPHVAPDPPPGLTRTRGGNNSSSPFISIILLYILVLGGLTGLYLLYKLFKTSQEDQARKLANVRDEFNQKMQIEIQNLKTGLQKNAENVNELNEDLNSKFKKLKESLVAPAVSPNSGYVAAPPPPPSPVIKYAKYADQGDGFSVSELLNEEDNETIFEITVSSPSAAKLRVSGNLNAQQYALTNPNYFLAKVCKYDNVPSSNSRIITETPGELKLLGNKWAVVTPAKISFS